MGCKYSSVPTVVEERKSTQYWSFSRECSLWRHYQPAIDECKERTICAQLLFLLSPWIDIAWRCHEEELKSTSALVLWQKPPNPVYQAHTHSANIHNKIQARTQTRSTPTKFPAKYLFCLIDNDFKPKWNIYYFYLIFVFSKFKLKFSQHCTFVLSASQIQIKKTALGSMSLLLSLLTCPSCWSYRYLLSIKTSLCSHWHQRLLCRKQCAWIARLVICRQPPIVPPVFNAFLLIIIQSSLSSSSLSLSSWSLSWSYCRRGRGFRHRRAVIAPRLWVVEKNSAFRIVRKE